jgi:cellulase
MKSSQLMLAAAAGAAAHSHVTNILVNGDSYAGFNTKAESNPAVLAAWSTTVGPEDGWVGKQHYNTPDIVCHLGAENAQGYAPLTAGDKVHFQWMGWPESHKGSAVAYLAACGGTGTSDEAARACAEVDKTELEFFQISQAGLLNATGVPNDHATALGEWATDVLIANNNSWVVEIPPRVAPGFYVLRHELIALHYATVPDMGPQHYPQCLTVRIDAPPSEGLEGRGNSGEEAEVPEGTKATDLYKAGDAGLTYDIFREELPPYEVPGAELMEGVPPMVDQTEGKKEQDMPAVPVYSL